MELTRWGVLGTAQIAANVFIPALRAVGGSELAAVASREQARADAFAKAHGARQAFGSYQQLLDSSDVDAVYVALPNSEHERWTVAAAEAGKPVFCEKPLTATSEAAIRTVARVRELGVPLLEAFVFLYHPQTQLLKELLAEHRVGPITQFSAELTFHLDRARDLDNYRLSAALGGGGLLDVVCYPIAYARHVLGAEPLSVQALVHYDQERGIDTCASLLLEFPGDVQAQLRGGFDGFFNRGVTIVGTDGMIRVAEPYHPPPNSRITLDLPARTDTIELDTALPAFGPAITHFQDCIPDRQPDVTADFAVGTLRVIEGAHESARSGRRVVLS